MLIGYARVSTPEQNLDLQKDALKLAGCQKIFTDKASGAKTERSGLTAALEHCRAGDTLVVWKLDRLGRSLPHLVETVKQLVEQDIGFKSLQESIDTTTSGGKLIFHIFASLAEFERDIIRERTNAGLSAARARGRMGGRPKGVDERKRKAVVALSKDRERSVKEICEIVGISRNTYYKYLNYDSKPASSKSSSDKPSEPIQPEEILSSFESKVMKVKLWLRVGNDNPLLQNQPLVQKAIESNVLSYFGMKKLDKEEYEYILAIPYTTEAELDNIIEQDIFVKAEELAAKGHCFIEVEMVALDNPDKIW